MKAPTSGEASRSTVQMSSEITDAESGK